MLLTTTVAFTGILCAPSRAYGDLCCAQTANIRASCKQSGCSGTITYRSCADPNDDNSVPYKTTEVRCCTETFTSYTSPQGGQNGCNDNASIIPSTRSTPPETALYAQGIWVRSCGGKYVFTVRPS